MALNADQKKKLAAYMLGNQKRLPSLLSKIPPGKEGRFAFVTSKTGSAYALLTDPKTVPPKSIEAAKEAIGAGAVVRKGILEHTEAGPFIFWMRALLPPLSKALKSGGLKSVKPLAKATVQIMSKEKLMLFNQEDVHETSEVEDGLPDDVSMGSEEESQEVEDQEDLTDIDVLRQKHQALTAAMDAAQARGDDAEEERLSQERLDIGLRMHEIEQFLALADADVPGNGPHQDDESTEDAAAQLLLEERLREEQALGGAAELQRREQEYAQLTLKGIEERAELLDQERTSAERLPIDDPNRQPTLDRLDTELALLARAQEALEENIHQVQETRRQLMEELTAARERTTDVCARFEPKEQVENAKKTKKLLEQGNEEWVDTIETMSALQQEKDGLQQGVDDAGRRQEELARLQEREERQIIERDLLQSRVTMLEVQGTRTEQLEQSRKELRQAEARLQETEQKRQQAAEGIKTLAEDADKTKLKLLREHAETNSLLDSRADAMRRKLAVEEGKEALQARQEAEQEAAELKRQEEALMKQLPPSLPDATKEWSRLVAMLSELKAERELLDSQSGFFSRYSLFSATRKRAAAAKERLPDVEEQIRLLEIQVMRAQEKVSSARQGGDAAIQQQLDAIRVQRSGADQKVAAAKLREADTQATLRQQEAEAATLNRDLRKQALDRRISSVQERDPEMGEILSQERAAKNLLSQQRDEFDKLQRRETEIRDRLRQVSDQLVAKIGEQATTPHQIQARDEEIVRLRADLKKEQAAQNDLLVRRRINADERRNTSGQISAAKKNAANRLRALSAGGDLEAMEIQAGLEQLQQMEQLEQAAKNSAEQGLKEAEQAQVQLFVARQNAAAEQDRASLEAQIREDWALIERVHNEKFQVDLMTEEGRKKAKKELKADYPQLEQMQHRLEQKVNGMLRKGSSPLEIKKILGSVPNNLLPISLRAELDVWQQMQASLDPSTDVLAAEAMFQDRIDRERSRLQNATPEAVQEKLGAFNRLCNGISDVVGRENESFDGVTELLGEGNELVATVNDTVKSSLELAEAIRSIAEAGSAVSRTEFDDRINEIWAMVKKGKFADIFKVEEQEELTKEGLAKKLADAKGGAEIAEKVLGGTGLALEIIGDVRGIAAWNNETDMDKKAEMEDAFFEKLTSLGSSVTGFVGSFLDNVPVLGVVSSTLSLIANASARKWHNRYVALGQQAARLVGDALATAFEEAMVREKQLLSRYIAKVVADVTSIAAGIVSMATGATGIGAAVGAAMAIGAGVVKLGTKLGSWIVDKWQMRSRQQLEKQAKEGDMDARVQLFREHPKYAKTMIAKEAMNGNGFAKAYCHGHGLSKSMLGKMDEAELTQVLLERHEQTDYFEKDNSGLEQMVALAKEIATAVGKITVPALSVGDKKAAAKVCQSWLEAVQDAETLDIHRRSFVTILDRHQRRVENAPPEDQPVMMEMLNEFTAKLQVCVSALRAIHSKTLDVLGVLQAVPSVPDLVIYRDRAKLLVAALSEI